MKNRSGMRKKRRKNNNIKAEKKPTIAYGDVVFAKKSVHKQNI